MQIVQVEYKKPALKIYRKKWNKHMCRLLVTKVVLRAFDQILSSNSICE